jgi:hypothetical protein
VTYAGGFGNPTWSKHTGVATLGRPGRRNTRARDPTPQVVLLTLRRLRRIAPRPCALRMRHASSPPA